jgi:hypothetical protein
MSDRTIPLLDFPFRRLLRLAGSRWRYSTPPPNGFSSFRVKCDVIQPRVGPNRKHGFEPFLHCRIMCSVAEKYLPSRYLAISQVSSSCLATVPSFSHPLTILSAYLRLGLPSGAFLSGIPINILYILRQYSA